MVSAIRPVDVGITLNTNGTDKSSVCEYEVEYYCSPVLILVPEVYSVSFILNLIFTFFSSKYCLINFKKLRNNQVILLAYAN